MQPTESVEVLNQRLVDYFGYFEGQPSWRVVFSDDQLEKRRGTYRDHTKEGLFLREVTEIREVPKYRQWIQHKWILERLTAVPEMCQDELLTRLSYEPIWVFEDKKGNPLDPIWMAIEYLVTRILGKQGRRPFIPEENAEERISKLEEYLFGNETDVGDALAHKEGIVVPENKNDANTTDMDVKQPANDKSAG